MPNIDLNGKNVLVTGGTGSFGKAFVRFVLANCSPGKLIVYSRDELKQYEMQEEFCEESNDCMRYFIGDIRDQDRLEMALRGVDYVVHAAALKHVPIAEYNPIECIHTNVLGAENVVRASLRMGVRKIIALSTDKAANPVNLYGASKLAADKIFVAANNLSGELPTRFSVVRYGNVLGSRGSVLNKYRSLIRNGVSSLPITDPRMTRFWITISQGVEFVLSCLCSMAGGEIFVPKLPSMKVVDLATFLAPDLKQDVIGIRPGEKLHEILVTEDDSRNTVELEDRYVILPAFDHQDEVIVPGARRVADGFMYSSDRNTQWLDEDGIQLMLEETHG